MSLKSVNEIEVVVRRDAYTITHVQVPPYEASILRNLFGRENIIVIETDQECLINPEREYDRLCAKYGYDVVVKVFGEDDGDRLMDLIKGLNQKSLPKDDQLDPMKDSSRVVKAEKRSSVAT
jgi:hypothetical protein